MPIISATIYLRVARRGSIITGVMSLIMNNTHNIPDGLKPPMQNDPGVFTSYGNSPFYKFVTACVKGERIHLWESLPVPDIGENDEDVYLENVIEPYSLIVLHTTQVDGESITEFRTQNRKRTVPILKRRRAKGTEEKFEEQTYTSCVPYTVVIEGIPVARSRLETHTRLAPENELPQNLVPLQQSDSYALSNLDFYDIHGDKLEITNVLDILVQYTPAIQIADPIHVVPFFSRVLQPETLFLVVK